MTEKVLHEYRVIETEDGFRIEIKGDKEKLRKVVDRITMRVNGGGPRGKRGRGHGHGHEEGKHHGKGRRGRRGKRGMRMGPFKVRMRKHRGRPRHAGSDAENAAKA